jgi:hypothetical protein
VLFSLLGRVRTGMFGRPNTKLCRALWWFDFGKVAARRWVSVSRQVFAADIPLLQSPTSRGKRSRVEWCFTHYHRGTIWLTRLGPRLVTSHSYIGNLVRATFTVLETTSLECRGLMDTRPLLLAICAVCQCQINGAQKTDLDLR